ncbi:MAG: VCBS repeat-containing protein, partial [Solirubrobacteraceae bacterium]|nr:VCBS repeat-containing protein [Solirubrobacteraceae bacterium]
MLVRLVVLTALLVAASALPASADVFAPGVVVPGVLGGGAGPNQNGVVVADFDGDGRDDLAVADPTRGGVRVLRSRGDGTFFPGERGAAGFQPYALGAIELDPTTPGRELVVSSLVPSDIRVLARRPDGRWEPRQRLTVATGPFDLAVGDIDGDDLADVVALGVGGSVDLLLQRSGRLVPSVRQHIVARPYTISLGVAIADLDDDGDADIASADWLAGPLKSEIRTLLG